MTVAQRCKYILVAVQRTYILPGTSHNMCAGGAGTVELLWGIGGWGIVFLFQVLCV